MLPLLFAGFSSQEKKKLQQLNWRSGQLADIPSDQPHVYYLSAGELLNQQGISAQPLTELYGSLPFIKKEAEVFQGETPHAVSYLPTPDLALFLMQHSAAMQSYLKMASYFGLEVLTKWQKIAAYYLINSQSSCWESAHLALALAHRQAKLHNQKSVYLEFQNNNIGIFNIINQEVLPAIVLQESGGQQILITDLLKKRTYHYNDNLDIINVQFLSPWLMDEGQWQTLAVELNKLYVNVFIHCGDQKLDFLDDYCRLKISVFDTDETFSAKVQSKSSAHHQVNILRSPTKLKENKRSRYLRYPYYWSTNGTAAISVSKPDSLEENYLTWLDENFSSLLNGKSAVFFGDCFSNEEGLIQALKFLSQSDSEVDKDQNPLSKLDHFFKQNQCFFSGFSTLYAAIAALSGQFGKFEKIAQGINANQYNDILYPVFPKTGIFSRKKVEKYLEKIFGELDLQGANIHFTGHNLLEDVNISANDGRISEIMPSFMLPPGFLDEKSSGDFIAADTADRFVYDLALAYRLGFDNINFIYFEKKPISRESAIAELLLLRDYQINIAGLAKGNQVRIFVVPYSNLRKQKTLERTKAPLIESKDFWQSLNLMQKDAN